MKLQNLSNDIIVLSTNNEQWATVQNILLMAGRTPHEADNDTFEIFPYTSIPKDAMVEYLNTSRSVIDMAEFLTGNIAYIIPASSFITSNS
jgi:hypothetical protein